MTSHIKIKKRKKFTDNFELKSMLKLIFYLFTTANFLVFVLYFVATKNLDQFESIFKEKVKSFRKGLLNEEKNTKEIDESK